MKTNRSDVLKLWEKKFVTKTEAGKMLGRSYRLLQNAVERGQLEEHIYLTRDQKIKRLIEVKSLRTYALKLLQYHTKILSRMVLPDTLTKDQKYGIYHTGSVGDANLKK